MLIQFVVGCALSSGSLAAILSPTSSSPDATITPGPQIELLRKQNNDQYIGWGQWQGVWTSEQCLSGLTYFQTSNYWQCCYTSENGCAASEIAIGCISGNLIFPATGTESSDTLETWPCTSAYTDAIYQSNTICNTVFMFENDRDSNPRTNVNCGISSLNWSYYRNRPTEPTSSLQSSASASRQQSAPSSASVSPTAPPAIPTPITPSQPEKKESKAWIAGAVVGPIVGLALIGFIAWFLIRRKKNSQQQGTAGGPPTEPDTYQHPPRPNSPPQYYSPPMQQDHSGVPFGVAKHDSWGGPQSATSYQSTSSNAPPPQQWQAQNGMYPNQAPQMGGQPVYGVPSPSMSPQPGQVQPAQYDTGMYKHTDQSVRPFSSELEGSQPHGSPEIHTVPVELAR